MLKYLILLLIVGTVYGMKKPCGNPRTNLKDCVCEDGETYVGPEEIKENCGRRTKNRPTSCNCVDETTWEPPTKPGKPCGGKNNVDECTCEDGQTCSNKRDCRRNCNRRENPVESCSCSDGTTWEP